MRSVEKLVHTRARVRPRYALMPLEGFPVSRLPTWPDCDAMVLASPALGAQFVQTLLNVPAGKGTGQGEALTQVFGFVLSGAVRVMIDGLEENLGPEGFFFVPELNEWSLKAGEASKELMLQKRNEVSGWYKGPRPEAIIARVSDVPAHPWGGTDQARLQTLLPDTVAFDMAMNIFTFDPGYGLPIVETHVMEHGLYFLQGKGLYYLENEWMEVEQDDFIWMGPYCPQSFYATGPTPSRYLYYKNVNREIPL
jgi:(S)-ureidoglycine aminohydrolase